MMEEIRKEEKNDKIKYVILEHTIFFSILILFSLILYLINFIMVN